MVVLILWIIEGAVGLTLFLSWLRHARGRGTRNVVTHLVMMLAGLAFWVWFVASGALLPAWTAFAIITVGIGFGDAMLLGPGTPVLARGDDARQGLRRRDLGLLPRQTPMACRVPCLVQRRRLLHLPGGLHRRDRRRGMSTLRGNSLAESENHRNR